MSNPAVIGLDIAKNVFQVHGADAEGRCVLRRRLRRAEVITFFARLPKALVGIEACPGGHHWARELRSLGHEVRLIPPQYVRPFVKTNKNDAADAEGICEAVVRPNMRFVPIKSVAQQAAMMLHRTRALLLRQRTQLINAVRGHLAEFGLIARRGARNIRELTDLVRDTGSDKLPDTARAMLVLLLEQIREAELRVRKTEQALEAWAKQSDACRRLLAIPGVGIMSATALVLAMDDPKRFRSGRHFAAWLGLVPRQSSSGERQVLGGNQQARRRLCPHPTDPWGPIAHQMASGELGLVGRTSEAAADQCRGCRDCEQDSAHSLGDPGPWPSVSADKKGGSRIGRTVPRRVRGQNRR